MANDVPVRPLDPKATAAADQALYQAHETDPRPNALFDAGGRRQPLSADDPAQECLRQEWIDDYGKAGGKLAPSRRRKKVGSAVQSCPKLAALHVMVLYTPLEAPVEEAEVTLTGPVSRTALTDAAGVAEFLNLPPGSYSATAHYRKTHPLVEAAARQVASSLWAVAAAKGPFPASTNKCNLFVYDVLSAAGYGAPTKPHTKLLGFGATVMLPLNAGDWADASRAIASTTIVALPEPGDIVAWRHDYSDATGHVGFVSYPQDSAAASVSLSAGDDKPLDLKMVRRSISAGEYTVDEDDWHFWHYYNEGNTAEINSILFRRLSP